MERRKKFWSRLWLRRLLQLHPAVPYSLLAVVLVWVTLRPCCTKMERASEGEGRIDVKGNLDGLLTAGLEDHPVVMATKWTGETFADVNRERDTNSATADENAGSPSSETSAVVHENSGKGIPQLGRHVCVIQPVKSLSREWNTDNVQEHVALKAFLASFVNSIDAKADANVTFSIYYGYDTSDPVFGNNELRQKFTALARSLLGNTDVKLYFMPLYGLEGRLTGIWNDLARSAYHGGCDYFFMSNDDMGIYTKGWASMVIHSFETSKYRRCKYMGIVRFKDEWAKWATFTFHVSSRLHMEIFKEVYYRVPFLNSHNDLWIHQVYRHFGSNLNRDIRVRNRIHDFKNNTGSIEPPRYEYDKKEGFAHWMLEGRATVDNWIKENSGTRCVAPDTVT